MAVWLGPGSASGGLEGRRWGPAAQCSLSSLGRPKADARSPAALRSGLVPLHPASRGPGERQALAAQHCLHASIFEGAASSWEGRQLGTTHAQLFPDASYGLAAVLPSPEAPQLAVVPFGDQGSGVASCGVASTKIVHQPPCWSPGSTHVAFMLASPHAQGGPGGLLELLILRPGDGASRLYEGDAFHNVDLSSPSTMPDILWAPCSPQGRPRLAIIRSDHAQEDVRLPAHAGCLHCKAVLHGA